MAKPDPYLPARPGAYPRRPVAVVSVKDWILTFIILALPLIGLIALFIWAFGYDYSPSKRNFARAALIIMLVLLILAAVAVLVVVYVFGLSIDDYLKSVWW